MTDLEPVANHPEIAYKLWVENGRDAAKVAALLRAGNPDEDTGWPALPGVRKADVDRWSRQHGWLIKAYDDARQMAPDRFAHTREIYERTQEPAAQFIGDVIAGKLDDLDPRVVKNRMTAAMHVTAVTGHLPVQLMDSTKQHAGPQHDYTRPIADLTIEELRARALHSGTARPTVPDTLAATNDAPDIIDVESNPIDDHSQSASPSAGRSAR